MAQPVVCLDISDRSYKPSSSTFVIFVHAYRVFVQWFFTTNSAYFKNIYTWTFEDTFPETNPPFSMNMHSPSSIVQVQAGSFKEVV